RYRRGNSIFCPILSDFRAKLPPRSARKPQPPCHPSKGRPPQLKQWRRRGARRGSQKTKVCVRSETATGSGYLEVYPRGRRVPRVRGRRARLQNSASTKRDQYKAAACQMPVRSLISFARGPSLTATALATPRERESVQSRQTPASNEGVPCAHIFPR